MKIDVVTLFPDYFSGPLGQSMMRKATEGGHADMQVHDLRQWGIGPRKQVDDMPYGGGAGMVLRPEPLFAAFTELSKVVIPSEPPRAEESFSDSGNKRDSSAPLRSAQNDKVRGPHRIYLTPQGKPFKQADATRLSKVDHLIILAGHYEGIDYRVRQELIDEEISIGDYVLTGGELPALVVIDAVVRLIPGVLGDERSDKEETFSDALQGGLEYPHYTRPEVFKTGKKSLKVPEVLLSGHHGEIERWRINQSQKLTNRHRPDLR